MALSTLSEEPFLFGIDNFKNNLKAETMKLFFDNIVTGTPLMEEIGKSIGLNATRSVKA